MFRQSIQYMLRYLTCRCYERKGSSKSLKYILSEDRIDGVAVHPKVVNNMSVKATNVILTLCMILPLGIMNVCMMLQSNQSESG